jgi:hypothetical protein
MAVCLLLGAKAGEPDVPTTVLPATSEPKADVYRREVSATVANRPVPGLCYPMAVWNSTAPMELPSDSEGQLGPLVHELDLARPPLLGEEGFERAVEAHNCIPALAGHGLKPVAALDASRLLRPEIDRC